MAACEREGAKVHFQIDALLCHTKIIRRRKNRDNFLFPTMLTVAGIHYISVAGSDPTLNDIFKKFTFCKTLTRVWYRTMLKIVIQL